MYLLLSIVPIHLHIKKGFYEQLTHDMKINERVIKNIPLPGLLVFPLITPPKFHICPQSFASRPNTHFSRALSADIPGVSRELFTK